MCSIKVYGKVENDKNIDFAPMAIIQDVDYDFIDTINSHKEKENAEIAVIVPNEPVKEGGFVF